MRSLCILAKVLIYQAICQMLTFNGTVRQRLKSNWDFSHRRLHHQSLATKFFTHFWLEEKNHQSLATKFSPLLKTALSDTDARVKSGFVLPLSHFSATNFQKLGRLVFFLLQKHVYFFVLVSSTMLKKAELRR